MKPEAVDYLVVAVAYKIAQTTSRTKPVLSSDVEAEFDGALSDRGVLESLFRAARQSVIGVQPHDNTEGVLRIVDIPFKGVSWIQQGYDKYASVSRYLDGIDNAKDALEV